MRPPRYGGFVALGYRYANRKHHTSEFEITYAYLLFWFMCVLWECTGWRSRWIAITMRRERVSLVYEYIWIEYAGSRVKRNSTVWSISNWESMNEWINERKKKNVNNVLALRKNVEQWNSEWVSEHDVRTLLLPVYAEASMNVYEFLARQQI